MTGGSFNWPSTTGPAYHVTNSNGVITLKDVVINNNSSVLIKVGADRRGGLNGDTVVFTADQETLIGSLIANNPLGSKTYTLVYCSEYKPANVNSIRQQQTLPTGWVLKQNYLNQFNPSTSIDYQLPVASRVTIIIYNSLGKEVTEPVNAFRYAGKYSVTFVTKNLSGGIYY